MSATAVKRKPLKARCCWCGQSFVRVNGSYWCSTAECRVRQAEHAIASQNIRSGDWTYAYVPLPMQVNFDSAPVRYLLGGGAAGVSKSHMARWGLYRRAIAVPNFEGLILRETWNELEKHHLRLMEQDEVVLNSIGVPARFSITNREMRLGDGSILEGGHMEDPSDVKKYLSRERDAIVADEGTNFQPKPLLELSTRARSVKPQVEAFARAHSWRHLSPDEPVPGGGAVFWILSNPGGPAASMIRELFIDHTPTWEDYTPEFQELYDPTEWGYVPGNLEDNPYLPQSYERDLADLQPWRYKQLRYNDWDVVAGQFFTEFNSNTHVRDLGDPGDNVEWFRSLDWGYVAPGVCLWWACLPDGIYYIRAEYKFDHLTIFEVAAEILRITKDLGISEYNIRYTVADPSMRVVVNSAAKGALGGEGIDETFSMGGIPLIMGTNDRRGGWQRIREMLRLRDDGNPTVIIHPDCRYLIRTMSAAVSSPTDPEDIRFADDHALDSERYGAMSRPAPTRTQKSTSNRTFKAAQQRTAEFQRRMSHRRWA